MFIGNKVNIKDMKKLLIVSLVIFPGVLWGQIGVKGGLNFANITKVSSINNSSNTGFSFGLFLAPKPRGLFGFHSEIDFSRQGYNFETNTNTGNVDLDYILLPQLSTINITRFVQIQIGAQMAFLINAKAVQSNSGSGTYDKLLSYYNRFDYGLAGGLEIHPFKGLIVGGRYNLSLGNMYKDLQTSAPGSVPSFVPSVNVKNNVLNIYLGWHFVK
jgi:hypothetical protein